MVYFYKYIQTHVPKQIFELSDIKKWVQFL